MFYKIVDIFCIRNIYCTLAIKYRTKFSLFFERWYGLKFETILQEFGYSWERERNMCYVLGCQIWYMMGGNKRYFMIDQQIAH